ncbi:MAG: MaoC/PaaZ C-terminal domain-containing protein [Candidatus Competibacterales bacterium]
MRDKRYVYYDDVEVGTVVATGSLNVAREDMVAFARAYDPQPMHLDEAAARLTPFKTLVGSGWHCLCLTMRLVVEAKPLGKTPLIGTEITEVRIPKPLLPATQLRAEFEVLAKRPSSKPGRGYLQVAVTTYDQDNNVVLSQRWTLVVPTRSGEEQQP